MLAPEMMRASPACNSEQAFGFLKCPQWRKGLVRFLDVHRRCIYSMDSAGSVRAEAELPFFPAALFVLSAGQVIVADAWRRILYRLVGDCRERVADVSSIARWCLSDAVAERENRLYVGDVGYNYLDPLIDPVANGAILTIDNEGNACRVAEGLYFPNGMVVTPDLHTLIVAEKFAHRLTAFDIASDGLLRNRRTWARLPDDVLPDGICLDAEGAIWTSTSTPQALRVEEGGRISDRVLAGQSVFAVSLAGPDRRRLVLCTSASSDPIETRRSPSATLEAATVRVAGV